MLFVFDIFEQFLEYKKYIIYEYIIFDLGYE